MTWNVAVAAASVVTVVTVSGPVVRAAWRSVTASRVSSRDAAGGVAVPWCSTCSAEACTCDPADGGAA
ncbi:hypothetical protein ACR8AL_13810 [Clavibacter sepedonicus]|uniref:hypothetical protein n=1 Tax=Clavibacter TaxID=1573 RepID=UPI00059C1AB3|nr:MULTISPECIES: hypothetical protein [Clavibacter]MBD5380568.1 hypothetical protein [Clavibacter sp.]OQJ47881.1 hypothetical protein B5P19_06015 [Clavibacter sepedonicus]OQJ53436.1 hypothetical protein B5P20_04270 [Clavibacter sepedonicus]UUK64619.1 hypothetical protein LRE50_09970 [Clavibacter sepedonicus]